MNSASAGLQLGNSADGITDGISIGFTGSTGGLNPGGSYFHFTGLLNFYNADYSRTPLTIAQAGNVAVALPSSGTTLSAASSTAQRGIQITSAAGQTAQLSFQESGQVESSIENIGGSFRMYNAGRGVAISNAGNVAIGAPSSGTTLTLTGISGNAALSMANAAGGGATLGYYSGGQSSNYLDGDAFVVMPLRI